MQLKKLTARGDTIVEVLVVIAIIGVVLGGAYAFVNRNVKNNQQAQEHSRAVRAAESQLEMLRNFVANNPIPTGRFCFIGSGSNIQKVTIGGALPAPALSPAGHPGQCKVSDGTVAERYLTGIKADSGNKFTVYVTWVGPNGNEQKVSTAYKVYK